VELKERLICDWEDKKKQVENDKVHIELSMGKFVFLLPWWQKMRYIMYEIFLVAAEIRAGHETQSFSIH